MPEQLTLTLPFEQIQEGSIAARAQMRSQFQLGTKASYKIPFNEILLRPGSNHRKIFHGIPELADSILKHGQEEPFELYVLKDGRSFLKEGERRYRAYTLLVEEKKIQPDVLVEFFPSKTDVTEMKGMIQQYVINNFKDQFKPIENAGIAFDLKYHFGEEKSNEEVAQLMNVSRQTVDNLIELFKLPDLMKDQIYKGEISATDALANVRSEKKLKKQSDKKEEESGQTSMYVQPEHVDELAGEMADLEALDRQAENYKEREAAREKREAERLERDAILFDVTKEVLTDQIGKRLAADAVYSWQDTVGSKEAGDETTVDRWNVALKQGEEITEEKIDTLIQMKVEKVYVYKQSTPVESVITEPPAVEEKSKFDLTRIEIAQVTNCIKLADKLEAIVNKLDVNEGTKKDVADIVKWMQKDLDELRAWVHKNKPQNKRGS